MMNYKITLGEGMESSHFFVSADTGKDAVKRLVDSGKITLKPPIHGKVYPKKGKKILEFMILTDKEGKIRISFIEPHIPPKFKFSYKIEHDKFLEGAERNDRYYILLTGIDLKYHGTYKTFVIMKDEAKRLYDSGKRVSIAVLKDNITFTYTSLGVIIERTLLEEYVKTHTTATLIKFKPIKE